MSKAIANPERGEAPIFIDGEERIFRFGLNEVIELQTITGAVDLPTALRDQNNIFRNLRVVLFLGLRKELPELDELGAGELFLTLKGSNMAEKVETLMETIGALGGESAGKESEEPVSTGASSSQ